MLALYLYLTGSTLTATVLLTLRWCNRSEPVPRGQRLAFAGMLAALVVCWPLLLLAVAAERWLVPPL